jgi:DNA-binding Xre family transcriptional regulator
MIVTKKEIKYPENLELKVDVIRSGRSIKSLAQSIGVSRQVLNLTVNGHYKGVNIIKLLKAELETQLPTNNQ